MPGPRSGESWDAPSALQRTTMDLHSKCRDKGECKGHGGCVYRSGKTARKRNKIRKNRETATRAQQ